MYIDNENFDKWMEKLSKKLNEIGQNLQSLINTDTVLDPNDKLLPAPGFVFHGHVLGVHLIDLGRELDVVRIVVHDEVAQPQMPCDASHALRDLLFDGAVGDVGIGLVRHPLAEAGRHEPLRDGGAQRHGM